VSLAFNLYAYTVEIYRCIRPRVPCGYIIEIEGLIMTDKFQTYIISMDRSSERLKFITDRVRLLGVDYKRVVATDGSLLDKDFKKGFAAARPRDGRRGWATGQIGCFMSHEAAWHAISKGNAEYGLVLEDDLHLSPNFKDVIESDDWIPKEADLIRLEDTGQRLKLNSGQKAFEKRKIYKVGSAAWGAGGYIIRKTLAERLINVDCCLHTPVDDFLFNLESSSVSRTISTYQLVPAVCIQDKFEDTSKGIKGFGSEIETDKVNMRLSYIPALKRSIGSILYGKKKVGFY
jgi:glycosyl transferase family 25